MRIVPARRRPLVALAVAADVLDDAGRDAGDAGVFPWCALGDSDEGCTGDRDVVDVNASAGPGPVSELAHGAVERSAESSSLGDGGVHGGIVAGWQRAGRHLGGIVVDGLGEPVGDRFCRLQQSERVGDDSMLERRVARASEWPPEREVAPQPTRRSGSFDLRALRTEGDGGEPGGFEDVGERTHGTRGR